MIWRNKPLKPATASLFVATAHDIGAQCGAPLFLCEIAGVSQVVLEEDEKALLL